jgi:hypothetical protein
VDSPAANTQLSGTINVAGWALDDVAVSRVYVDGVLAGTSTYGGTRPDVANDWPHAAAPIGYNLSLHTTSKAHLGSSCRIGKFAVAIRRAVGVEVNPIGKSLSLMTRTTKLFVFAHYP